MLSLIASIVLLLWFLTVLSSRFPLLPPRFFVSLAAFTSVIRCKDTENSDMKKAIKEKNAEISARIREIIEDLNLSPNAFALKLNYKRAQTVYDILNGKSAPSYDFFNRFMLSEYSVTYSMDWLLTGRGNMYLPRIGTAMELGEKNILQQILKGSDKQIVYAPNFEDSALLKAFEQIGLQIKSAEEVMEDVKKLAKLNGELTAKAVLVDSYMQTIVEQSREIGRLEQRIKELEQRLEKTAGAASTGDTANVG